MSFGINHSSQHQDTSQLQDTLYNQNQTQTGEQSRILTPEQLQAQSQITQLIHALATNPDQFLAPAQNQARNQVNENYSGVADNLRQQFLGNTGGGGSGKYGTAALQSDLARRGDLSKVDTTFATEKSQLPFTAAGLAQQLLSMNMGTKTTATGTNTGNQTTTSTGHAEGGGTGVNAGVKLFGLG
jgi:hypothetical protein